MKLQTALSALSALMLLVLTTGCVPTETVSTGVPAASADKFYFHLEREANARGYDTWRDAEAQTLSVEVDRGELDYRIQLDEIVVDLSTYGDDSQSEGEIQARLASLRQLHERLLEGATQRAERVSAFD